MQNRRVLGALIVIALSTFASANEPATAESKPMVVYLRSHEPGGDDPQILVRELVRQSLLIAARDGLRLSTRDEALREPIPADNAATRIIDLHTTFMAARHAVQVDISMKSDGKTITLPQFEVPVKNGPYSSADVAAVVETIEPLTRTKFIEVLEKLGLQAAPAATNPAPAVLPDDVEPRLYRLSFFQQFAAVREAHSAIRDGSESLATLGALVRGYANLSRLTQFQWTAAHKTFAARSLLYAQRMVNNAPHSVSALQHRAYARALVGLHAAALADLAAPDPNAQATTTTTLATLPAASASADAPTWVSLLSPLCNYDTDRLINVVNDPDSGALSLFFGFLSVQNGSSQESTITIAKSILLADPACFAAYNSIAFVASEADRRYATDNGAQALTKCLAEELPALPGFPKAVGDAARRLASNNKDAAARVDVVTQVIRAGDTDNAEPSWGVLGSLINETQFLQTYARAMFVVVVYPAYAKTAHILVNGHPYAPLVETIFCNRMTEPDKCNEMVKNVSAIDMNFSMYRYYLATNYPSTPRKGQGRDARLQMFHHADYTAGDLSEQLAHAGDDPEYRSWFGHALYDVSPRSPTAMGTLIHADWQFAEKHLAEWNVDRSKQPYVLGAMAERMTKLKRPDEATRYLERYVSITPDRHMMEKLASNYLAVGDEAKWLKIMERAIDGAEGHEQRGLRLAVGNHYMKRREFGKAKPYIEATLDSGWFDSVSSEVACYTGLGEFDRAQELLKQMAQHGPNSALWWYWCDRSGHGDATAARKWADQHFNNLAPGADVYENHALGVYRLYNGKLKEALKAFNARYAAVPEGAAGMHALTVAIALHDNEARDAMFQTLLADNHILRDRAFTYEMTLVGLAKLMKASIEKGDVAQFDLDAVEKLNAENIESSKAQAYYFVAKFLDDQGKPDEARRYYELAADPSWVWQQIWEPEAILAAKRLREMKGMAAASQPASTQAEHSTGTPR